MRYFIRYRKCTEKFDTIQKLSNVFIQLILITLLSYTKKHIFKKIDYNIKYRN